MGGEDRYEDGEGSLLFLGEVLEGQDVHVGYDDREVSMRVAKVMKRMDRDSFMRVAKVEAVQKRGVVKCVQYNWWRMEEWSGL